jgi:uncharacterized protein HemX
MTQEKGMSAWGFDKIATRNLALAVICALIVALAGVFGILIKMNSERRTDDAAHRAELVRCKEEAKEEMKAMFAAHLATLEDKLVRNEQKTAELEMKAKKLKR